LLLMMLSGCLTTMSVANIHRLCQVNEWVWSNGENWSTRRETFPSAALSTAKPTWTLMGKISGLWCWRPETNRQSHGLAKVVRRI